MSSSGDVGKAWLVNEPGYSASNFIRILRPDGNYIMPGFLRYVLESDQGQTALKASTAGTTIQNLQKTFYSMLTVPLPALAEQQRIVRLLDEAFEGIAIVKANAEKNLQNARALFESRLHYVYTRGGKGWTTKALGEVLERTESVNPLRTPNEEFEYIDVSSVSNVTFDIQETQRLQGKDAPSRARKLVREDDIIFATVRPTLQRIAVVPEHLDKQICSTGYVVLRPKPGVSHRFLFHSLFTPQFKSQMETLQRGASYPAVTDSDVRNQYISIPDLAEQVDIARALDELSDKTRALASAYIRKITALESLKSSLLDRAFSGHPKAA
jgi:type I restriction enzyme S subunit